MASTKRLNKILNHLNDDKSLVQDTSRKTRTMKEIEEKWNELVGIDLGTSTWITLTQKDLDTFSDLTVDHNWIHKKGAGKKGSPFGDTIAHGLLTLSMLLRFVYQVTAKYANDMSLNQIQSDVNYGFDKVRFIGPVFVDNQ
eukprot:873997_1